MFFASISPREADRGLNKVAQINLEYGSPTVEQALAKMKNALATHKAVGGKAVILIHGYGSSGVGGGIKSAVCTALCSSGMRGIVRSFACGAEWAIKRKEMLAICPGLAEFERRIAGNEGVTAVVLR